MIIYGINSVSEALESRESQLDRILVTRGKSNPRLQRIIDLARSQGVPLLFEPLAALNRRAGTTRHQDVVAELTQAKYLSLDELLERNPRLLLAIDGVEDPRNLGAVLRTAEAAGVQGVVIPHRHGCGITAAVIQASAGAALSLPACRVPNLVQALRKLKQSKFWVIGLELGGTHSLDEIDPELPVIMVVGGEHRGVRPLVRAQCDFLVSLPMRGRVSSLNLAVATGILLYRWMERRPV